MDLVLDPERRIDAVLLAGDLFDGPNPATDDRTLVREGLERLGEAGKTVVAIPGIHDGIDGRRSVYVGGSLGELATCVTEPGVLRLDLTCEGGSITLHAGVALPGARALDAFAGVHEADPTHRHAGLFLGALEDTVSPPWGVPVYRPEELQPHRFDLLVLGGTHQPRDTETGSTTVVVPGSPVGLGLDEPGPRSWAVASLGAEGVSVERIERKTSQVRHLTVDVGAEGLNTVSDLRDHLRPRLSGAARARLSLVGLAQSSWSREEIEADLADLEIPMTVEVALRPDWSDAVTAELGGSHSLPTRLLQDLDQRREAATSDRDRRVLDRALTLAWNAVTADGDAHVD